jgi:dipeptidase
VKCTYIEIPQVRRTHAVLLAKPFWIWGAEMGANEHGLAIGNEAVFSKIPAQKREALLGMDLLRLALERAATARQGVEVITALLEAHGQGGDASFAHSMAYHNSYLLADPAEAWVLETVDRHWAAKRVEGIYTISNCLTIQDNFDLASADLVSTAVERGWCRGETDFDFARCYSDFLFTRFSDGHNRCSRTRSVLEGERGAITAGTLAGTLRDHGLDEGEYRPARGLLGAAVCMHAAFGPVRFSQTTGSLISQLDPRGATHFVTGTAAPCTGIFKPVWIDAAPDFGPAPEGTHDPATLFWSHEVLHRATLRDYPARARAYRADRDRLETEFIEGALALAEQPVEVRRAYAQDCWDRAAVAEAGWLEALKLVPPGPGNNPLYNLAWWGVNRQAGMAALP